VPLNPLRAHPAVPGTAPGVKHKGPFRGAASCECPFAAPSVPSWSCSPGASSPLAPPPLPCACLHSLPAVLTLGARVSAPRLSPMPEEQQVQHPQPQPQPRLPARPSTAAAPFPLCFSASPLRPALCLPVAPVPSAPSAGTRAWLSLGDARRHGHLPRGSDRAWPLRLRVPPRLPLGSCVRVAAGAPWGRTRRWAGRTPQPLSVAEAPWPSNPA